MEDRNPADAADLLGEVARSDADDVAAAVAAARAAYADWMATPMPRRGERDVKGLKENNEQDSLDDRAPQKGDDLIAGGWLIPGDDVVIAMHGQAVGR